MTEKELLGKYKLVLGLEVHMQPKTENKMFCGCSADIWEAEPNTHTCPVCLGLPGALPVPNFDAVQKTQLLGLALNCKLNENSKFDRKHYFYPDLPKGYQISQYKEPLCGEGYLELESGVRAEIERIHLEEDAAKSFHEGNKTLVDFNKGGMALIELVTKPTFKTVADAVDFCKKLQQIVRVLKISEVDMEKGQMRLEANISLRTVEMEEANELPKYKVEVKNINSFRFMEKAVMAEIVRQRELLESGEQPVQENRGYNEKTGKTVLQRSKEEAHDYRYFPEPDIPPMTFDNARFDVVRKMLVELPMQKRQRLVKEYVIKPDSARMLVEGFGYELSDKFENLAKELKSQNIEAQKIANLLLNRAEYRDLDLAAFKNKLLSESEKVSNSDELSEIVKKIVAQNTKAVDDYKKGKESAVQFLIGMVMRENKGKVDAKVVMDLIVSELKK